MGMVITANEFTQNPSNFINNIIAASTMPAVVPAIPRTNRFRMRTNVILMDEVPRSVIVEEDTCYNLDFWNEIEGFFIANRGRIADFRDTDWEVPELEMKGRSEFARNSDGSPLFVVGDRIVTPDYRVYKVYGFNHKSGGADIYFNIK